MCSLWAGTSDTIYSQQAGNPLFDSTLNGPFLDIASQDFPVEGSAGDPTGLRHRLEMPLGPIEGGEGRDGVVGSGLPKQEIKRKRGSQKLPRRGKSPSSTITGPQRIPHNKVERKYRQTLNAAMERLRAHVPTLPQHDSSFTAPPKPSKAIVLAAAVDYIGQLEAENKRLAEENINIKRRIGDGQLSIGRRKIRKPTVG